MSNSQSGDRSLVDIRWLVKLRWIAVVGQLATMVLVAWLLGIHLTAPLAMAGVVALTAASNLALMAFLPAAPRDGEPVIPTSDVVPGIVMVADMLSLTALLFASGGLNNPFALFYFVNVSLSAIVLRRTWAWSMTLLAVGCCFLLVYHHLPLEELATDPERMPVRESGRLSLGLAGLLVSLVLSFAVITYFVTRISEGLRQQELDLRKAQLDKARSEKLEALGTLAAGTAHELATPMSTIAVVARDVEKFFEQHPPTDPLMADAVADIHTIRSQLDRCRSILNRMAGSAGQPVGERIQTLSVADLWDLVLEHLAPEVEEKQLVQIDLPDEIADEQLRVPAVILSQSLRGLVQNALDAVGPDQPVKVVLRGYPRHWLWMIENRGAPIPPDVLQRISEPFFSTKPVGKGMGLGVFLARNVIERLGGNLDITSSAADGTRVTVRLVREETGAAG